MKKSSDIAVYQPSEDTGGIPAHPQTGGRELTGVVKGNCPIREASSTLGHPGSTTLGHPEVTTGSEAVRKYRPHRAFTDRSYAKYLMVSQNHLEWMKLQREESVDSQQEEGAAQGGASMDASRRDAPDSQAHRGIAKGDWTPNVKP